MTSPTEPSQAFTWEQVQAAIDQRVQENEAKHAEELGALTAQHQADLAALRLSFGGGVVTTVPEHAGGPGTEIAETWSLAEQQAAIAAARAG